MKTTEGVCRITSGPLRSTEVELPEGYILVDDGTLFAPGRVGTGPFAANETTVCLLPGDDGQWFKDAVERTGGSWKEYCNEND